VIAREITKRFETITRVPLAGAVAWLNENPDRSRGEFVLVSSRARSRPPRGSTPAS
jgi:16S rRNA (cytidine1402-2'-O)-methyltransferase